MTFESSTGRTAEALRRRVRIIVILEAAENAGMSPVSVVQFHTLAYLSNVLAPVWNMPTFDGKVLKRREGPLYPELQHDLDRLVGSGVVLISCLSHAQDENHEWHLEGQFRVNHAFADPVLRTVRSFALENQISIFVEELCYAISALTVEDFDDAVSQDATYSDRLIGVGNVIDFGEWRDINYSTNAARQFAHVLPSGPLTTPGELIHLYIRHMRARLHGKT